MNLNESKVGIMHESLERGKRKSTIISKKDKKRKKITNNQMKESTLSSFEISPLLLNLAPEKFLEVQKTVIFFSKTS